VQKRPKSRSPNSRVPECHVTVAGWASWKHHLGGFDAVGKCRCSGGSVKSSAKLIEKLAYHFTNEEKGLVLRHYWTNACQSGVIK
jgi:hypothetical protein